MKTKISNLSIEITNECNLNCKYCYNHWRPSSNFEKLNSYKKAIRLITTILQQIDVNTITFTGGEPLLSERFEEVVLFTRLKGINVNIITNGNLATKDSLQSLVNMGTQLFELPYHSMNSEIHDAMTNKVGSWQKSFNTIETITKIGGYVIPIIVLTKINLPFIEETLISLSNLGFKRIIINRFNIGGNGIKFVNELLISNTELQEAYKLINTISEKLALNISSNVCTPFCILNPREYKNITFGSCPSEVKYRPLTIDLNGDLRLCNHSPIVAGNVFNTQINQILQNDYVNKWTDIKPEICKNCDEFSQCLGGCRAASEQLNKTLSDADPILNGCRMP